MTSDIQQRKTDHIELCSTDAVAFRAQTTLLEGVRLLHQALPELAVDDLDLSVTLLGKRLRAPIIIAAMTGGTDRAAEINQQLAAIAEARGYGFGLGSQRTMQKVPETAWTYRVRELAPTTLLLGNVGVVQARDCDAGALAQLALDVGADALCVHMNPAMELIQAEGDRDFRGCLATFERLARELPIPVVPKETGSGISPQTARRLRSLNLQVVDVSGAGGTSWVGVEALRGTEDGRALGELLWDWGVPTAASVVYTAREGLSPIATGGIRHGLDIARAIALGATAVGMARPVLQALVTGGRAGAEALLDRVERELAAVMVLCGAPNLAALAKAPRVLVGELRHWLDLPQP